MAVWFQLREVGGRLHVAGRRARVCHPGRAGLVCRAADVSPRRGASVRTLLNVVSSAGRDIGSRSARSCSSSRIYRLTPHEVMLEETALARMLTVSLHRPA